MMVAVMMMKMTRRKKENKRSKKRRERRNKSHYFLHKLRLLFVKDMGAWHAGGLREFVRRTMPPQFLPSFLYLFVNQYHTMQFEEASSAATRGHRWRKTETTTHQSFIAPSLHSIQHFFRSLFRSFFPFLLPSLPGSSSKRVLP